MIHVCPIAAFGDCLITLSLLERLPESAPPYLILGTPNTSQVSRLLARPLPVTEVLSRELALYFIKVQGPLRALRDTLEFHRQVLRISAPGEPLALEFQGLRARLLTPPRRRCCVPVDTDHVYEDRYRMLVRLFGKFPPWTPMARPAAVRKLLVNPCARHPQRWVPRETMEVLCRLAERRGWELSLIDPCKRYGAFRGRVAAYQDQISLASAAALMKESDLYLGPDSFFLHLAYYNRTPCFGIFMSWHLKYLVPGMRELQAYATYEQARDPAQMERALLGFVDG